MAKIFNTKADLVASYLTDGQIVSTKGYYAAGDGGQASYLIKTLGDYGATPDGYVDHSLTNGNVAVLQHSGVVNSRQAGVKEAGAYSFSLAQTNRSALEALLRKTDVNIATIEPTGTQFIPVWGSVNVMRSNLTVHHKDGCDIRGYYSDPSETASGQAGHLFGFVNYANPYPGTDYTIGAELENIHYILDGKLSTIYDAGHTQTHNNNCIGFANVKNCSVTGKGGIEESDHNGISLDLDCTNCWVDLGYIRNVDSQAVKCTATEASNNSSCYIKVKEITGLSFDGPLAVSAILIRNQQKAAVEVGICEQSATTRKSFVSSYNNENLTISVGRVSNATAIAAVDNTTHTFIKDTIADTLFYGVNRSGTVSDNHSTVSLENVTILDSGSVSIYYSTNNNSTFDRLSVKHCDFSGITGTCTPYGNYLAGGAPNVYDFRDNVVGASWAYNYRISNKNSTPLYSAVGSSTTVYDFAGTNGDFPYTKIRLNIQEGTDRYQEVFDFYDYTLTGAVFKRTINAGAGTATVTMTKTGTSCSFVVTGSGISPSISNRVLFND